MWRYEIYLPLKFNDGRAVPGELFTQVRDELLEKYGGLTLLPPDSPVEGWWKSEGVLYKDDIVIYKVTTDDDEDLFFIQYQKELAHRFDQVKIWIEKIPIYPLR